jgi:hypothetical protein
MKRMAMLLSLVAASTVGALGSFEGVVTYQTNGKETMQYTAKGNKARMDANTESAMGPMAMIVDNTANTYTIVMPARKMYMTMPIPQASAALDTLRGGKVTKIGSETVAGIPCDDYQGADAKGEKEDTFCLAHGMGNFLWSGQSNGVLQHMVPHVAGLGSAISGGAFPLKVVKSNGEVSFLALKVERKSVDASLFAPPAGFTQMQLPPGMQLPQH